MGADKTTLSHIDRPVVIIGVGRSGSTLLHNILTRHPNLAWLSTLCDRFPDRPEINRTFLRALDYPLAELPLRRLAPPSEAYLFWERYSRGFRWPCRDLTSRDVTLKTRSDLLFAMSSVLSDRRDRLVLKITGWPRVGFLKAVFPGAKFIHIVRDGRAVANSMINVDWWWGWRGPQNWRWGDLSEEDRAVWEKNDRSFLALAGLQWNLLLDALAQSRDTVSEDDLTEVRYEDLCANPMSEIRRLIDFCELDLPRAFEEAIRGERIENKNEKYASELTVEQQGILGTVMEKYLRQYGYSV